MKNASKSKAYLWYGYLNAGERSSPVLRDDRLDTGNPKTLYLYNLARGQILEYSREIVEKKLREFKPDESGFIEELDAGYKKIRRTFKDRGAHLRNLTKTTAAASMQSNEDREDVVVMDDNDDIWMDAEEA